MHSCDDRAVQGIGDRRPWGRRRGPPAVREDACRTRSTSHRVRTNPRSTPRQPKKAAASGWIGSALEYYDFFIYAQAAALVFPNIFFPKGDPQIAIVAAFATFGVGYVARPIGAFVLGHLGDTHGRKNMLVLCMLMIGGSTLLVAFLPTYEQVGLLAPALLVVLRLIQGFAVGGEIAGASAMIVEHSPFGRRGYFGSFTLQGVQAGQVLAAAVFLPLSAAMSPEAFQSWGWRIPFLLSVGVVVAGIIIRRKVDETPAFQEEAAHGEVPKAPIKQAVSESGPDMLRVFCMSLMNVVPTTVNTFGATFATNAAYGNGFTTTTYLWISVVGNIVAVVLIPFVGNLTDRIGRRPCMIVGALGSGVMGFLYLYAVDSQNTVLAFISRHADVGYGLPGLQRRRSRRSTRSCSRPGRVSPRSPSRRTWARWPPRSCRPSSPPSRPPGRTSR